MHVAYLREAVISYKILMISFQFIETMYYVHSLLIQMKQSPKTIYFEPEFCISFLSEPYECGRD